MCEHSSERGPSLVNISEGEMNEELCRLLAKFIGNTHRLRRNDSLLTVADVIDKLLHHLGSLKRVSQRVGVSEEMLREFLSVKKLSTPVRDLLAEKRIVSVDVAYRLSQLSSSEQIRLAQEYLSGRLSGKDVRDTATWRRKHPKSSIATAIRRVKRSRTVRHYLVKVRLEQTRCRLNTFRDRIERLIGRENLLSVEETEGIVCAVINETGRKNIERLASLRGVTRARLVRNALLGG